MSELAQALGQRLKAERERRGMSTQKAADEMHLDTWVIDALETGDYQRLGAPVYAKGHLKKYASILGLPPAEIAAGFAPQPAAPVANPAAQPVNIRTMRASPAKATNLPLPQIAAVAAAALVIGGVAWWWQPWRRFSAPAGAGAAQSTPPASEAAARAATAAPASAAEEGAAAPIAEQIAQPPPEAPVPDSAMRAPVVPAANAHDADAALGAGPARLRLSFSADSWVEVHDADGRRVFAGNGLANSVKTIAGMAPLKVYLGFASGVQLELNDHAVAIGPQFFSGDVARFEAGADGVLRRAPRATTSNGAPPRTVPPHD